jgi:hypothetical protein
MKVKRKKKMWIYKDWRMTIVLWAMEKTTMIIRMRTTTITMKMETSKVMSIGIIGLSIMNTPTSARTLRSVNYWRNCCRR